MSEDGQTIETTETTETTETASRIGLLDLVAKVPFGAQAAVLAGVLVAGTGVAGVVVAVGLPGSTCCPPVIE